MKFTIRTAAAATTASAAVLLTTLSPVASAVEPTPDSSGSYAPEDAVTANWTREQALEIQQDETNTKPRIPEDFPIMTDEVWIWDTWPLTNQDMKPVTYKGWHIIFSLTAPRDIAFGDRHWASKIGYFYSRDGQDWTYGGDVFPAGSSLGGREWAGSTLITQGNHLEAFYTASGHDGSTNQNDALQRLAHASGQIRADKNGVSFTGFDDHEIIAEADGEMYQTLEQSQSGPIIYAFRDPFVFRNPEDGQTYALFEGNNGGEAGSHTCDPKEIGDVPADHVVPEDSKYYTGNIGLMKLTSTGGNDYSDWELLPPLLSAECTNQQTERPHLVVKDGQYYLWTISHKFTFAPGLDGPDGLYGFVGDGLRSDYQALNGSGLVLGNPEEAPKQNYSDYVMPNLLVESFIDTLPTAGGGEKFGGTLAPTLGLDIDGDQTALAEEYDYGYIPAMEAVAGP